MIRIFSAIYAFSGGCIKDSIKPWDRQDVILSNLVSHNTDVFSFISPAYLHNLFTIHTYTFVIEFSGNKICTFKKEKEMRIFWRILAAVVLIAAIVGIGVYAYNLGIAQGLLQNSQVQAVAPGQMPYVPFWHPVPGFGIGFGFLGCLLPLFLLFLVFGSVRALFWHGPWGWRHMHHGDWDWREEHRRGVPPIFDEWHQRAHNAQQEQEKKD
jgi:hypothetical protein